MVNNYTNINKSKNNLSPQMIEHIKDHDIWRWNLGPGLGQARKCGCVKPVNVTLLLDVFLFTVYQFSETPIFEVINQNKALFVITP